ncbi:cleft lip and palate associated transmembrane protein [Obba rivulosa]|uniref:Cleft lip and palate associated transmembrane protein n=1 Tax=Obba rivulosa TaxID=1052685 RepID=A0A8E2AZ89_9APHY|nr:cleft lip and palate associated transmembrane protein [Obba rivulosa]
MPSQANAPAERAAADATQAGNQEESPFRKFFAIAQQFFLMWVIMQLASKFFASKTTPPTTPVPSTTSGDIPQAQVTDQPLSSQVPTQGVPAWPLGIPLTMHVYLSTSSTPTFSADYLLNREESGGPVHFSWENITFGDWSDTRTVDLTVNLPESVQHNGSMWADVFLLREGTSLDPLSPQYNPENVRHVRKLLTRYLPKHKVRKEKKLLRSKEDASEEEEEPDVIASHWHQNLTLTLVSDASVIPISQLPPPAAKYVEILPELDPTGKAYYKPIVFPNDFWHLRSQYIEINTTTPTLPLSVTLEPLSYWKFQMYSVMIKGFEDATTQQNGVTSADMDELKRILVETNPYYLALTIFVSVLHVFFEFLAFSSDVSHWRQKKELVGVSVRWVTIITNVVVQTIIMLYLLDNSEQTSYMIIFSSGIGILIEAWKITKAVDIRVVPAGPGAWLPYKIDIKDKHVLSEDEKKTQEYDKLAFRIVSYFTIPCLAAYTVYSLMYETHRGWYSFVISTLTSFVYMFGFAQLIPQLIINYKLKSVAHMPMKAMIYKTLSTVVDDLFAFVIKMPILHRLACFRDDVVFLVFLYQRWIYRIDPKRVNEYGQVMGSEGDAVAAKKGADAAETKKNK